MAGHRAIEGVCNAIVRVLSEDEQIESPSELQVRLFGTEDFASPVSPGVSVYLYRVTADAAVLHGREAPLPEPFAGAPALPLELRYLITLWSDDAAMQARLAGQVLRRLDETPVFSHQLLEAATPGVFSTEETAQIHLDDLSTKDLLRIWTALDVGPYRLSLPYLVRGVRLDAAVAPAAPGSVTARRRYLTG